MLIASHFLLWIAVVLLGVAWFALARQVRMLGVQGAAAAPLSRVAVVSAATMAGETLTIGRASRDGRAILLLFAAPRCDRSAAALREAVALGDPARMRLVLVGEGDRAGFETLATLYHLSRNDLILDSPIADDLGIGQRPAAMLLAPDGMTIASGTANSRDQIAALLSGIVIDAPVARIETAPAAID
jgi:hypothetical protein